MPNFSSARVKKITLTTLQIGITLGVLWLVFHDKTKRDEMLSALSKARGIWLLAGIAVYGVVEFLATIRWQLLLRVQGIHIGWGRVLRLLMIGVFFNFFIPGGTGGDVVKTFYLIKESPGKIPQALLSVLVDRIIGLFSLIVLAGIFIGLRWGWLTTNPQTANYVWTGLAILGISFAAIATSFFLTGFGLIHKLPKKMPGRDKLAEFALAYNLYAKAWRPVLIAFAMSILAHFGYFGIFYCAGRAIEGTGQNIETIPTLTDLCAILPIVNTIVAMPISLGGLGVREKLFEVFLSNLCNVDRAIAVGISLTGYLFSLFWGLIGGVLYLFYRPSTHTQLRVINAEVAALEHSVAEQEIAAEIAHEKQR